MKMGLDPSLFTYNLGRITLKKSFWSFLLLTYLFVKLSDYFLDIRVAFFFFFFHFVMVKCIILLIKCDNVFRGTRLGIFLQIQAYCIALENLDPIVWYSYTCLSILEFAFLLFPFISFFELCEVKLSCVISHHS